MLSKAPNYRVGFKRIFCCQSGELETNEWTAHGTMTEKHCNHV